VVFKLCVHDNTLHPPGGKAMICPVSHPTVELGRQDKKQMSQPSVT